MQWKLLDSGQDAWDTWIAQFEQADIYHQRSYARLEETYHEKCYLLCCQGSGWKMAEIFQYRDVSDCRRLDGKIEQGKIYDIASMYGYGGPLIEGIPDEEELRTLWQQAACRLNINNYFVRFPPILEHNLAVRKSYNSVCIGESAVIPLKSREQIWNQMTSTCRNRIRNAKKAGVRICSGREEWMAEAFISCYFRSLERKKADSFYYFNEAYFQYMNQMKQEECIYFVALHQEKVIAAAVLLLGKKVMHYHLACSEAEYYHIPAANDIIYESALWGLEQGYEAYHLGSGLGGSGTDSLMHFKRGFAPEHCRPFEIGHMVFDEHAYNELNKMAGTSEEHYYPGYRVPKR